MEPPHATVTGANSRSLEVSRLSQVMDMVSVAERARAGGAVVTPVSEKIIQEP